MTRWKGVVAAPFSAAAFEDYVRELKLGDWRPQFVVLHNTQIPTLGEWRSSAGAEHMKALVEYYRDLQGWSAGPHLFVAEDFIWVFTPLNTPGVHSPSWNAVSWGVELVGDYDHEELPDALRANAVRALAALHELADIDPTTLKLHKEDPKTTHKGCPGTAIDKAGIVALVQATMAAREPRERMVYRVTSHVAGGHG